VIARADEYPLLRKDGMNHIYRLLLKTTLVAAITLAVVSVVTSVTLETTALVPMMVLAVISGTYARWQMQKAGSYADPRTDGSATITSGKGEFSAM
jgi:hypothetical protein